MTGNKTALNVLLWHLIESKVQMALSTTCICISAEIHEFKHAGICMLCVCQKYLSHNNAVVIFSKHYMLMFCFHNTRIRSLQIISPWDSFPIFYWDRDSKIHTWYNLPFLLPLSISMSLPKDNVIIKQMNTVEFVWCGSGIQLHNLIPLNVCPKEKEKGHLMIFQNEPTLLCFTFCVFLFFCPQKHLNSSLPYNIAFCFCSFLLGHFPSEPQIVFRFYSEIMHCARKEYSLYQGSPEEQVQPIC